MRIYYSIIAISLLISIPSFACDVCNLYEYSSLNNRSFFGIFYRYRVFNGYRHLDNPHRFYLPGHSNGRLEHEPENANFYADKTGYDYESYTTWELRGNWTINEKINLQFILPYEQNRVHYRSVIPFPLPQRDTTLAVEGWGDLVLAGDYIFKKMSGKVRHFFRPGLAVRLPTGQFRENGKNGDQHDPIIQPGTGAWSVVFRANYQATYRNWGANLFANYQVAGEGQHNYDFANSINAGFDVFHQLFWGNTTFIPRLGGYVESAGADQWNGQEVALTAGTSWFSTLGLDINLKKWTFQIAVQLPVHESLSGDQLGNAGRLTFGFIKGF